MKRSRNYTIIALVASLMMLLGGLVLPAAGASVVLSNNLNATVFDYDHINPSSAYAWSIASSFGTDNSSYQLKQVVLLAYQDGGTAEVQMSIYSNTGGTPEVTGLPDSAVGGMTSPIFTSTPGDTQTFTPSAPITLSPNTSYWVVVAPMAGDLRWAYAADNTHDPRQRGLAAGLGC